MSDGPVLPLLVSARKVVSAEVVDVPDPIGEAIRRLSQAVARASSRIAEDMAGTGGFNTTEERQTAHRLVAQIKQLSELFDLHRPPLDPNVRYIPPCQNCHAKAGEHWAHDCPKLNRFGKECTWDYRKERPIFYEQIEPLAEPLKPNPYDRFCCIVCRSRWAGIKAEQLIETGDHFNDPERQKLQKLFQERNFR